MLLRQIERFLRKTDMPCTRFGRLAAQDRKRPLSGVLRHLGSALMDLR